MPRQIPTQAKQQGVAALTVTILLTLIATVAAVYASKSSLITQKAAENGYQNVLAMQAAELGATAVTKQIEADLTALAAAPAPPSPQPATNILIKSLGSGGGGATGCALSGGAMSSPYEFKADYAGTDPKEFDSTKYVQATIDPVSAVTNVTQGAGWRAQAKIADGYLYIKAEGCVGNTAASPDICAAESLAKATVRRTIKLTGSIAPSNNALNIRRYMDTNSTFNLSTSSRVSTSAPSCGVLMGDGGKTTACTENESGANQTGCLVIGASINSTGNPIGKKDPALSLMSPEDYFKSFSGGLSKAQIKALSTTVTTQTELTNVPASQKFIWWEGNTTGFTAPAGKYIVINGNVTGTIAAQNGSFVYIAGNVLQNGAINIQGSAAVEGIWDRIPGVPYEDPTKLGEKPPVMITPADAYYESAGVTRGPNSKTDGVNPATRDTLAGTGNLTISYEKTSFDLPPSGGLISPTGSWIDF
ncbi:hypothetical protein NT239_03140 [Chitinibacter sp. SCUT-21]|uniref:pilus assembly PilX family protein n=1 Tax=Chitinibacter sp. SCUT-21 TaxID=2970891 RepID=UPI0035A5BCE1